MKLYTLELFQTGIYREWDRCLHHKYKVNAQNKLSDKRVKILRKYFAKNMTFSPFSCLIYGSETDITFK